MILGRTPRKESVAIYACGFYVSVCFQMRFAFNKTCAVFAVIWVGWNAALVYATKDFGWGSGQTIDCELPEAQMFYYVSIVPMII